MRIRSSCVLTRVRYLCLNYWLRSYPARYRFALLGFQIPDRFHSQEMEAIMAYGIIHRFAGGNEDQYRATLAAVHPSDGSLPAGQLFHAAGRSDDSWVIMAIHESKQSWEHFR